MSAGDYEVGYKKPPVGTRFKPGQSGNRKGRPKKSRNLKSDLLDELAERIAVREGSRTRRISKQRAMVKALVLKGLKGDSAAIAKAFDFLLRLVGPDDQPDVTTPLSSEDQAILDAFLNRDAKERAHD
jgi:hypothetical protein